MTPADQGGTNGSVPLAYNIYIYKIYIRTSLYRIVLRKNHITTQNSLMNWPWADKHKHVHGDGASR